MCKKCTKHRHTLLHRDAEYLSQRKPEKEDGKEKTPVAALSVIEHVLLVAALSVIEQVLLLTCKVKVTAAHGSSTIARAVIDPGSSASFMNDLHSIYIYTRFCMVPGVWH